MLFTTNLLDTEIKVVGRPLRIEEDDNLYEYGVDFIIDENERAELIRVLNLVQIKMKKDILFAEGSFTPNSAEVYFNSTS
ncbi:MAG: hypothetical protein GX339_02715 [Tissierellia bacterium]|nr:hypothetical protein [Tissierellia bacterium]